MCTGETVQNLRAEVAALRIHTRARARRTGSPYPRKITTQAVHVWRGLREGFGCACVRRVIGGTEWHVVGRGRGRGGGGLTESVRWLIITKHSGRSLGAACCLRW